jgi:hypothetical protein
MGLAGRPGGVWRLDKVGERADAAASSLSDRSGGRRGRDEPGIALLAQVDDDPGEVHRLLAQWYEVYQPSSAIECYLIEMIVHDLICIRRCRRCQDTIEQQEGNRWRLDDPESARVVRARRSFEQRFHTSYRLLRDVRQGIAPPSSLLDAARAAGFLTAHNR